MSARTYTLAAGLCFVTPALALEAQEEALARVPFQVSAVNGPVLTIDKGALEGLQKGDTVVLRRIGQPPWVGVVRAVEPHTARVELDGADEDDVPPLGARGEALVPGERLDALRTRADEPEHPPWKEPVGPWAPGKPLLAPARSPEPEERASELHGRVSAYAQQTDDAQYDNESSRLRLATSFDWDNPFARGGSIRFKGDVSFRDSSSSSSDETLLRLARFSYRLGGRVDDPYRVEVGRFLSSLFPEFGLLDGVEYVRRFAGGSQLGGSVGFQPDYTDDLAATDDLATALFYRWVSGPEEHVALGAGYQKTWHAGTADRDLLVGTARWIAGPRTTLQGSVLVDYYDGTAQLESQGFQLTELHASLNQRLGDDSGVGVYASYLDWPELLKDEFPLPPDTVISDQKVTRGGVNGWTRLSERTRLYARLDAWSDSNNSGGFADVRVDLRDALMNESELSLGVFHTQGSYTDGLGGRVRQTWWLGPATLRIGYEATQYDQQEFNGAQATLLQHLVSLGLDARLARDVDLSLAGDKRFGDEQDSTTMMLRLTWRF